MKVAAQVVCPERFPQAKHICPFKFTLVPDEQHAEEEEEVGRVCGLEVKIKGWIHELNEVVKSQKLGSHAGLIAEEISFLERPLSACKLIPSKRRFYHSLHETNKPPESDGIVLLDCVNRC